MVNFTSIPKNRKSCSRITVQLLNYMIPVFHKNLFEMIQKLQLIPVPVYTWSSTQGSNSASEATWRGPVLVDTEL